MEWFESCARGSLATSQYAEPPPLDPFPIRECSLDAGVPALNVSGYLSRLPDHPNPPTGQIADRAELSLAFMEVKELEIAGVPDETGGELCIDRVSETRTTFDYRSSAFRFSGSCRSAVIVSVGVLTRLDREIPEPSGPRLFSYHNVWNSCLLLLEKYGYSLHATGDPINRDRFTRLRWHATQPDGTKLTGDTPMELLGLAALHRHAAPRGNEPYWWRIEGPALVTELIERWKQQMYPPVD